MVCPKCGSFVNDGDNFCEECGSSVRKAASSYNSSDVSVNKSVVVEWDNNLAVVTNIGRTHKTNEDTGTVARYENVKTILVVADGVSSSVNAISASKVAVDVVKEILYKGQDSDLNLVRTAIEAANKAVIALPYETRPDGIYGPETTVVTALVTGDTAAIGWVGDSRAYKFSEGKQELLTIDDSWVELVVASGKMTRNEAISDKRAHYVTQILGMHDQAVEIHLIQQKLEKDDMLMLCSDGLWNYFQGENALLNAITTFGIGSNAVHICEHLVQLANAEGGRDNITVALLKPSKEMII